MIAVAGTDLTFYFKFTLEGVGATGLTVTCQLFKDNVRVTSGAPFACTELDATNAPGIYYYTRDGADVTEGDWLACAADGGTSTSDLKHVDAFWIVRGNLNLSESPSVTFDVDLQYLRRMLRIRLNDLTSDGDPGGNYDTEALDFFINLAYRETVRKCKSYYTTLTVPVTDDVEEYDGTTLYEITHVVGTAADSQPLKRTTMRELLVIDQDYRTAAKGTAAYWYPTKGGYFGLYPKPTVATTLNYYVSGYAYPTALTADAHTPVALPDGDAIQVLLDRAECHARRARPTHANNVPLAAQLEASWLGWCQEIRDSIRAEGN